MVARRTPTVPKAVLAGFRLEFCSAIFRAPMDAVSDE